MKVSCLRCAEYLSELLNCINLTDLTLIDLFPQLPVISQLDDPLAIDEIKVAVKGSKKNKAAEPDGLPAEVFKYGGHHLNRRLHQLIHHAWTTGKLPQQWKDANIITVYKEKSDGQICGNSCGISVLFVTSKILLVSCSRAFSIMLLTLSQCSFHRG